MRLPETVKVGPVTYAVQEVDELDGGDSIGQYHKGSATIKVVRSLPDDVKLVTFWHEVMHAICETTGQKHNERVINAFSHSLVVLFEANGWRIETG